MRRVDSFAIYAIFGFVWILGIVVFIALGGASHIDYKTGIIRDERTLFGVRYSTRYTATWIANSSQSGLDPNWGLIGYHNSSIKINTKGAKVIAHLHMLENYLLVAGATDETRQLVADWVLVLIHDIQIDRDQFGYAMEAIDCFFEKLPFPEDPDEIVTYEQVQETIDACSQLE
jgi:hypothetical protein